MAFALIYLFGRSHLVNIDVINLWSLPGESGRLDVFQKRMELSSSFPAVLISRPVP